MAACPPCAHLCRRCRYLDVFVTFISVYNTLMKILFVGASCATVFLIFKKFPSTYDGNHDTFRIEIPLIGCFALSMLPWFHYAFTPLEVLWAFSIYLEAVAIMPQLFMLTKTGSAENITSHHLFALSFNFDDCIRLKVCQVKCVCVWSSRKAA